MTTVAPDTLQQPQDPATFAARLRRREPMVGYWIACDNPTGTERIAGLGYDYIGIDGQHGILHQAGWQSALMAVDSRQRCAGVLRVPSVDPIAIGMALDTGARGVIVPMITTAQEAALATRACRHQPKGTRSLGGPVRGEVRLGSVPDEVDDAVACIVMIETAAALENLEAICTTPELDAVYVGPADLSVALGARYFGDPNVDKDLHDALRRITQTAQRAGIACGIHCQTGDEAARRLSENFTFATVSSDITHLQQTAADHLAAARSTTNPA